MKVELSLRIVVLDPPDGVSFALQRGQSELLQPAHVDNGLSFDFTLAVADADSNPPRLTGPFAQGPPKRRFVYVNSGTMAGQETSCWTRRAKVPLYTLHSDLVQEALTKGALLEAVIAGKSKDHGPACATVPFIQEWAIPE